MFASSHGHLSPPFLQNLRASAHAEKNMKHDHLDQVARSEPNRLRHGSLKSHCRERQEKCLKQMKSNKIKLACTSCNSLACKRMELGKTMSNAFKLSKFQRPCAEEFQYYIILLLRGYGMFCECRNSRSCFGTCQVCYEVCICVWASIQGYWNKEIQQTTKQESQAKDPRIMCQGRETYT